MVELFGFLKKRREGKLQQAEQEMEAVRRAFTQRYLSFKSLLSTNDRVLEIINELEQVLLGGRGFGMSLVRSRCTALSVDLFKIIQNLNQITDGRFPELFEVFQEIWSRIDQELKHRETVAAGEWILPLAAVTREMSGQAGGKMANLGEVKNRLGLPVPDGFVITSAAYQAFIDHNDLQEEINRRFQLLDPNDIARLHETSAEIQQLITRAALPPDLEAEIRAAYRELQERAGRPVRVSLRSSALGEDAQEASFAGQYRSLLNVSEEFLLLSYKEVAASKYSVPAIAYRLNKGFHDEDILMGVGCMTMIPAQTSGVMYSADPGNPSRQVILINAVWGLGKSVVDGSITPDLFLVSKTIPSQILEKEIKSKPQRFVCQAEEGVEMEMVGEGEKEAQSISDEQVLALAGLALQLEKHFGVPQDIEWAFDQTGAIQILQSRPLMMLENKPGGTRETDSPVKDLPVLLSGGVTASPGAACGPVFIVENMVDLLQFPAGAVLVTKNPLPQWAAVLNRAAALVTDQGAITGHLSAVAREFKVPALMGTQKASRTLEFGEIVTVDADGTHVYAGRAETLLQRAAEKINAMKGSPVEITLRRLLKHIAPLTLTDPEAPNFSPRGCQTLHDIIRFAHEMSLRELFDDQREVAFSEKLAKKLTGDLPMQWWVIDLEGGLREGIQGGTIRLADVSSRPLLALWKGLRAVPWQGPPAVDAKGFLSILAESAMDTSLETGAGPGYGAKNYVLVSENFCHLSTRLGFHFSTVEAFLGEKTAESYVWFYFKGGGADLFRKEQRGQLIRSILEQFGFWVQIRGDIVSARLERQDQPVLVRGLEVLGYLILHTRQLDMVLGDPAKVRSYQEKMMQEIGTFLQAPGSGDV
ncbi:MAG: pyruvate, water dikinase [Deltaproteobacteria bacterium]|nr:pyruvate, water dikinase [Deltaproteobacteria bacterium]